MTKDCNNNDYSMLIESEQKIFSENIELLKSWRKELWESVFKGNSAYLVPYLDEIIKLKDELTQFKQYAPIEIYENFVREYDMTMFLLNKCLIKASNNNLLPIGEEENLKIKEIISKLSNMEQENENIELIVSDLRKEDPTVRKTLESLGLPEQKIEEIIRTNYTVNSVLDETLNTNLKK